MTDSSSSFFSRQQWKILISLYLGYGAMMVCRQMLTILSPALLSDPSLELTKTNIADFSAWGTIGALCGKFIWGPLGDKIGGKLTFLLGVFLSALSLLLFSQSLNVYAFTIGSFLLYFSKSAGWPGMTKIVGEFFEEHQFGKTWGILSTSSRLSVVLGTLGFGFLLSYFPWKTVAIICVLVSLAIWISVRWFVPRSKKDQSNSEKDNEQILHALIRFSKDIRCYLVILMIMLITCMMAFLDLLPLYLLEIYKLEPSQASMISACFPFGCLLGLCAATILYDRLGKKQVRRVLSLQLLSTSLLLFVFHYSSSIQLPSSLRLLLACSIIIILGFMIAPSYYIPSSIFSIEFGMGYAATLVCLIDAFSFGASAGFNLIAGRITDSSYGWSGYIYLQILISIFAAAVTWLFLNGEYQYSLRERSKK